MDRDDATWTTFLLAEHRSKGEYLVHSARMVGDEDDYAVWRQGRRAWTDATAATIEEVFSDAVAADFCRTCADPPLGEIWKRQYERELRSIGAALQRLAALSEEIERRAEMAELGTSSRAGVLVGSPAGGD